MAKTKFTDKDHLEHFEKQLALRDTYIKENGDYIETKRDKIGLSSPEILAELCFALHMEDEIDDDGKSWLLNYMSGKIYHAIFKEEKDRDGKLDTMGLLLDLAEKKDLTKNIGTNNEDVINYIRQLRLEIKDEEWIETYANRPNMKSSLKYINSCTGDLFRQMQTYKIKVKEQIEFVIGVYSDFKYFDFANEDIDGSKFRRVEKQRERSLVKHK